MYTEHGSLNPEEVTIKSIEVATLLAEAAIGKKATDVVILDVADKVGYAEIFVVCTGNNPRQIRAIANEVRHHAKGDLGIGVIGMEGMEVGRWVLVDLDDVVMHIFDQKSRLFFDLEGLWSDVPRLPVPDQPESFVDEPVFILP